MTRRILLRLMLGPLPVTLLSAGWPAALQAQRVELQVLGGEVSDEAGSVGRGLTLAPAIAWSGSQAWLRLDGRGTALESGGRLLGAGAAFHLALYGTRSFELGTSGSAGLLTSSSGYRSLMAELAPGIRFQTGAVGLGAGVGVRAAAISSAPPGWRGAVPLGALDEDVTAVARSAWVEARTVFDALTLGAHVRASRAVDARWQEGQAGASLELGRVVLAGFVGARAGDGAADWGGGSAAFRILPGVELLAQLAQHPSDPLTGQPGGRTAALGVTLSRAAPAPRAGERDVRLTLRAAPGARVELLADWTDWHPQPVTHRGDGVYDVELRLPPGVYHFVFRVDGELRVPEGYETAPDDFGGRSAVVRVRG